MLKIYTDSNNSPLDRLIELSKQEARNREEKVNKSQESLNHLNKQVALLANEFFKIHNTLYHPEEIQDTKRALEIHLNNFNRFLQDMHFKYHIVKPGAPYTESMGKEFPFISARESDKVNEVVVEKMISPAIFCHDELIKGGELLLLQPRNTNTKADQDKDLNKLKNIPRNEN